MPVHRVIFRLDYSLNYEVIDGPGKLMRLLNSDDEFWDSIKDALKERSIGAEFSGPGEFRSIVVGPTALVFNIENVVGLDPGNIMQSTSFSAVVSLVNQICDEYKIQDVRRAGLRFWAFEKIGSGDSDSHALLLNSVNDAVSGAVADVVGPITDTGLAFDGGADERSKYHVRFGPFAKDGPEAAKYLESISEEFCKATAADAIFDVDLYEESFSLKGRRPGAWIKHQSVKFSELITKLTSRLQRTE